MSQRITISRIDESQLNHPMQVAPRLRHVIRPSRIVQIRAMICEIIEPDSFIGHHHKAQIRAGSVAMACTMTYRDHWKQAVSKTCALSTSQLQLSLACSEAYTVPLDAMCDHSGCEVVICNRENARSQ